MTNQPSWHCIANIGDADPYEHGGAFVLVDRRGVYPPELILVESFDSTDNRQAWNIQLEPLTVIKSVSEQTGRAEDSWIGLSDNKYHVDKEAWFGDLDGLQKVATYIGDNLYSFMRSLLSNDPIDRAIGYRALANYHGIQNFDEYPQTLTEEKARLMCDRFLKQIEESESWHDGYFGD
jgi:hypothetical protein